MTFDPFNFNASFTVQDYRFFSDYPLIWKNDTGDDIAYLAFRDVYNDYSFKAIQFGYCIEGKWGDFLSDCK